MCTERGCSLEIFFKLVCAGTYDNCTNRRKQIIGSLSETERTSCSGIIFCTHAGRSNKGIERAVRLSFFIRHTFCIEVTYTDISQMFCIQIVVEQFQHRFVYCLRIAVVGIIVYAALYMIFQFKELRILISAHFLE